MFKLKKLQVILCKFFMFFLLTVSYSVANTACNNKNRVKNTELLLPNQSFCAPDSQSKKKGCCLKR